MLHLSRALSRLLWLHYIELTGPCDLHGQLAPLYFRVDKMA